MLTTSLRVGALSLVIASVMAVMSDMPFDRCAPKSADISLVGTPQTFSL